MNTSQDDGPQAALDRLVDALVSWGATASQIVGHMEQWTQRSGATQAQTSTVEAFSRLLGELAGPLVQRGLALDGVAQAIEAIDEEVREQVLFVAPPEHGPWRHAAAGRCERDTRRRRR